MMFSGLRRRRRIYLIVMLIAIMCAVVLCFQFFLFGVISDYHDERGTSGWFDRGARPKYADDINDMESERHMQQINQRTNNFKLQKIESAVDCKDKNCSGIVFKYQSQQLQNVDDHKLNSGRLSPNASRLNDALQQKSQSYSDVWHFLEHAYPPRSDRKLVDVNKGLSDIEVRGINPEWLPLYAKSSDGFFKCLLSQEKIDYMKLNDDYCDCLDQSDEPGTSACAHGRFYCSYQSTILGTSPKWLPSSRVNDGICDCCDGSDEWTHRTLPDHVLKKDGVAHYHLYQAPCIDRCEEFRQQEAKIAEQKAQGLALKAEYLKAGEGQSNPDNLYGPGAVFYKLRSVCFDVRSGKYSYSVCPYGPVKQTDAGNAPIIIGHTPQWLQCGPSVYRLMLSNGDATNCPQSQSRLTVVEFECGVQDHVVSITESEVCQYLVRFSSPAAC